ncbi:hypothetical protein PVIIG_04431 [Plasmodium vivax India VII]|uniref:Regulator of chromosome condensation n=3 Tax=Plasmodium vivax TaxID=5855 RepID=A5K593_PLAVS|nr:hypothetical protein, conserved [Plasmodium vivax]EDL45821.1 hypothetical protein, conserved [Plasmodium vivax]KMZ82317.1 hypothetical protein PVIIG_04431 [Plasmodium vivax India VII]CAI7720719.1 conserved Plasmodium protein, unknown function [Plasmodium vivax]SCO67532.1 conserved Plasmodium protein, unknown function [Plasmodium vivax]|eukprot:XP_001615548.1 hypothetical protein [Plasmodium vivax Sal-1]
MTNPKGEAFTISNVYLHRDGQLELIKELENVIIRGVFTCGHSINIFLKGKEGSTSNAIIQLDSSPLSRASSSGKSFLNISYSDINDCEFLTSDFVLYALRKGGTPPEGPPQHGDHFCHNNRRGSVLQRREIKSTMVHRGRVATWYCPLQGERSPAGGQTAMAPLKGKAQNGQNAQTLQTSQNYAKWLPANTKAIFLGELQFYGVDEENKLFTWHTDLHSKDKMIYNYQTKFVKYVAPLDKIKIASVSCGQSHALFLAQNKNCYAMGSNDCYQVGAKKEEKKKKIVFYSSPQLITLDEDANKKVKFIAAGYSHNLICTYQNEVYGWGNNLHGQLFLEDPFVKGPTLIFNPKKWHNFMVKKKKLKRVNKTVTNGYKREIPFAHHLSNQSGSSNPVWSSKGDEPSQTGPKKHPPQEYPQTDKFTKCIELINRDNQGYKKATKWRDKNKFKVAKLCCGFSFSCLLLKNQNCYVVGKTNPSLASQTEKIHTLLRINKKKKIDDIFCNFFNIILVENLKIEKISPQIIHPSSDRAIFLHLNFPLKDSLNCRVGLVHTDGLNHTDENNHTDEHNHTDENNHTDEHNHTDGLNHGDKANPLSRSPLGGDSPDCQHKEDPARLHLYLSYDNGSDEEGVGGQDRSEDKDGMTLSERTPSGSTHPFAIPAHTLWGKRKKKKYWTSCQFYKSQMERKLFLSLHNEHFYLQHNQCSVVLSTYSGQVLRLSPDNCSLMRNIKLKIKIEKAPIQVESDNVYVLFHFTDEHKNEVFKFSKGRLRRGGNYIYTKVPSILEGDIPDGGGGAATGKHDGAEVNSATSDGGNSNTRGESAILNSCMDAPPGEDAIITHRFTKCNVHYSLGHSFYASSLPLTIIKPDILNITPNFVHIHDNRPIRMNMLHLSSSFEHIFVTLSNPRLPIIRTKAYYDCEEGNFFFAVPPIPTGVFQRAQLGFLTLHVFVSYNNVEYSQNEVILTISNVNQEGRGEDTNGGNGEGKA